jgi:hypothetical protein
MKLRIMLPPRVPDRIEGVERSISPSSSQSGSTRQAYPGSLSEVHHDHRFAYPRSPHLPCLLILGGSAVADDEKLDAISVDAVSDLLKSQNAAAAIEEQMTFSAAQHAFGTLAAQGIAITEPMQAIIIDEARKSIGSKFSDDRFLADLYALVYAGELSIEEIRELTAFWTSAIGKKLLAVNPTLSKGTFDALQEASAPLLLQFQKNVDAQFMDAGIVNQP